MNKDELVARAGQINAEMIQCRANYAKLEGHLAEVTHWLQEHEKGLLPTENGEQEHGEVNDESAEQTA